MIFTFVFVRIVNALVYSGDLSLEFPIATECCKLTFALDLGLDVDEYLKISFPFIYIVQVEHKMFTAFFTSNFLLIQ